MCKGLSCLGFGSLATAVACSAQSIEFRPAHGEPEEHPVSRDNPAKLHCDSGLPPLWAQPLTQVSFRIQVGSISGDVERRSWWARTNTLQVSVQTAPPGLICQCLGPVGRAVCKDCSQSGGCPVRPRTVVGSQDLAVKLPPRGGFVYIHQLPEGASRSVAFWEWTLDPAVFFSLFLGLVLVWGSQPLSESAAFHAGIGGVASLASLGVIVLMLCIWIIRSAKGTVYGTIPFGRSITTLLGAIVVAVPAARDYVIETSMRWLPDWLSARDWSWWIALRDPWLDLPVGWLVFLAVAATCCRIVVLGANFSVRQFASAPDPEGPVDFFIDSDGRRVDRLPSAPISQKMLGWLLWSAGCSLLLSCTHSDVCNFVILALTLAWDRIQHVLWSMMMKAESSAKPEHFRTLISQEAMQRQASAHTEKHLAQLQRHLAANPSLVRSVRDEGELRLRRFMAGEPHARIPVEYAVDKETSRCCIL
eukprot:TRINITY_DN76918_c0_g1_i1.p1 TRINITY_DN76918_c0_g1~~TRINITY_DN76918_c0_g1_i1.p1  ORF type:complete len:475 (+),score=51.41 TRINITY_DN76918_c0_g1_i1:72-1496(+)